METSYIHVQSMRLADGAEALVAVALTTAGTVGFGIDLKLDATAARHMALRAAGIDPRSRGVKEATVPGGECSPRA